MNYSYMDKSLETKCLGKETSPEMLPRKDINFCEIWKQSKTKQYCLGIYLCDKNIFKKSMEIINISQDIGFFGGVR